MPHYIGPNDSNSGELWQHHADCDCNTCIDHASHAKPGIHTFPDRLHVVCCIINPLRWRARYWNYSLFERHIADSGAILYTVEVAYGDRHFEVTDPANERHLQLRTRDEIWHKENALNLGMNALVPIDAKYIAWIDADVKFARPDWAQETLHQLQHYDVVQMFSHAQDVGPHYEPLITTPGFLYQYREGPPPHDENFGRCIPPPCYYSLPRKGGLYSHPGFAWAARAEAIDKLGGLIDWAVLGSGDWHMASALVGQVDRSIYSGFSAEYKSMCHLWQNRAEQYIRRNVGYVPGLVNHYFHGKKANRQYDHRWKFLAKTGYAPSLDLKKDRNGLFMLTDRSVELRDGLRVYARMRDEDGTEV